MKKRIGILTSGGDCPGLNAVLRGVVRASTPLGWEVIGFLDGFEGLLSPVASIRLDRNTTAGILSQGGTILGTTNRGRFVAKVGRGERNRIPKAVIRETKTNLQKMGIDALICVGGDGSLTTALQLFEAGIPVIGVPKTIDNDLDATAMTFGFDSAVACVVDALDRLHTTADSHKRVMVTEVMGRHAGWIALYGGLAGGGDIILIPEIPFTFDSVADAIMRRQADAYKSTLIVVAEGARPKDGKQLVQQTGSGEYKLGGIGDLVAREVAWRTGRETRNCVLGHLQRGGVPTPLDRILGTCFGAEAVELVREGRFGHMVSYQNEQISHRPIAEAVHRLRLVPLDHSMLMTARSVGVCFGDEPEES